MSRTKDMRAPRGKTSRLLLLLLLLAAFNTTVLCQYDGTDPDGEVAPEEEQDIEGETAEATSSIPEVLTTSQSETDLTEVEENPMGEGSGLPDETSERDAAIDPEGDDDGLDITIILIPVVLVFLIIAMIAVGLYISRKWNSKAANKDSRIDDTNMEASQTEKVPMPMFEDDVPSVLELEMEELDQWLTRDS